MLFRKKIEHSCAQCVYGVKLDDDTVLCSKKGVRSILGRCCRFRYDPIKRIPKKEKAPDFRQYDSDDFKL